MALPDVGRHLGLLGPFSVRPDKLREIRTGRELHPAVLKLAQREFDAPVSGLGFNLVVRLQALLLPFAAVTKLDAVVFWTRGPG
jgi:hypothetical protein